MRAGGPPPPPPAAAAATTAESERVTIASNRSSIGAASDPRTDVSTAPEEKGQDTNKKKLTGSKDAGPGNDSTVDVTTLAILYGPLVQFARHAKSAEPTVVAMPTQLPVSVDVVFKHPPEAALPDSLSHFCFSPLMKLQESSRLTFCLTDSKGAELFGVSLQKLCPQGSQRF
eukprot:6177150-Pleurochrysis_carterae.AAC.2